MAGNDERSGPALAAGNTSTGVMSTGRRALLGAALAAVGSAARATTDPVAESRCGKVRGLIDQGIQTFKGIPYASAAERFQPPKPMTAWTGVREPSPTVRAARSSAALQQVAFVRREPTAASRTASF